MSDIERRRVFVPQALGADEFLRVTWHERKGLFVFSHWVGNECVAATPVRVDQLDALSDLLAASQRVDASWPAPDPADRIAPPTPIASATG